MFPHRKICFREQMARIVVFGKHLEVSLSALERRVLGRPTVKVELSRISDVRLGSGINLAELGTKVSRSSIFGGILGEYRAGAKKIMVLGRSRAAKYLVVTFKHPSIDEIWVSGPQATELESQLKSFIKPA